MFSQGRPELQSNRFRKTWPSCMSASTGKPHFQWLSLQLIEYVSGLLRKDLNLSSYNIDAAGTSESTLSSLFYINVCIRTLPQKQFEWKFSLKTFQGHHAAYHCQGSELRHAESFRVNIGRWLCILGWTLLHIQDNNVNISKNIGFLALSSTE